MWNRRKLMAGLGASGLGASGLAVSGMAAGLAARAQATDELTGDVVPVHDPCMIRADGQYHVFTTSQAHDGKGLIHWRTSPDRRDWTFRGGVMTAFPDWVMKKVPQTRGIWAPDISFAGGLYRLYYSASTFGSNQSVIGLLTNPVLDPANPSAGWRDAGLVVESRPGDTYNAIDPNFIAAADGRHWLAFGSFWSGLKLVELDPATGLRKKGAKIRGIAGRERPGAIEAPFLFRRGEWHYLMASYDFCCRGADSSYYTAVGRSRTIDGPYVDDKGRALTDGGGRVLLNAAMDPSGRFKGPGGGSVVRDGERYRIVYHAYDTQRNGAPTLRIRDLDWTADGWPVTSDGQI